MQAIKVNICRIIVFASLAFGTDCSAYEDFYYLEKGRMESRLFECLKKWPGILVNYPQSSNPKEIVVETNLVTSYGLKATLGSVLDDSNRALSKGDYYGLVMICASILSDNRSNAIKQSFVKFAKSKLGNEKYVNSILAFCVKTLISKSFLMIGDSISKDRMGVVFEFVTDLRLKGFEPKGYEGLMGIDNKILEDCFLELMR